MKKHIETRTLKILAIICVCAILSLFIHGIFGILSHITISANPPEHQHIEIRYTWNDGLKYTPVTICCTTQTQFIFSKEHRETTLSKDFFKTEADTCK